MNILVTGGNGYIGSHLVEYINKRGYNVRVCDLNKEDMFIETGFIEYVYGNLLSEEFCINLVKNIDIIVHLAGVGHGIPTSKISGKKINLRTLYSNCQITQNLLNAVIRSGKCKKFIFVSSGAIYGDVTKKVPQNPYSVYEISKNVQENIIQLFSKTNNIDYTILRLFNVYGSINKYSTDIVSRYVKTVLSGKNILITGNESYTRDYIYIIDLIEAIYEIIRKNIFENKVFDIGTGVATSNKELANCVLKEANVDLGFLILKREHYNIPHSFSKSSYDLERLIEHKVTSLEEGIRRTIKHWRET